MNDLTRGFEPILGRRAEILILGTLPSLQSLKLQQYYGHPRNAFWPIMGKLYSAGLEIPYPERTRRLSGKAIAVWDVLAAGHRPGSMDAAIDESRAEPNDFGSLWREHPEIRTVCFNGQAAARLFSSRVANDVERSLASVRFVTLPSTSPAHAAMSLEDKFAHWAVILPGGNRKSA